MLQVRSSSTLDGGDFGWLKAKHQFGSQCAKETSHVLQHFALLTVILMTSSVKTIPRVGARPSTRLSRKIACSTAEWDVLPSGCRCESAFFDP